ncbi:MaoC family dehydratase [Ferribacterium limneticum]|uniref:MaoC-like dehydratase n=1 Tax=Dechloromonas aromatica (strain RCB) TaxID=159087 RepID=Q47AD5_DECAR|nr:MaoC family dehydratase [Ferribacterium limneticum]UCV29193.1 MaoC family dehydratase [Ferribacterium limneticum]UCV33112.1 MaoC family dehydratase [Ferribacterium limneticum]
MAYHIDQLQPGMSASIAKTVTETDIILFAGISTDVNPAHLDEEYAKTTMFGGRIAHGMLSAGFISAVLANHLPGAGTIYLSQTLKFKAPVRPGDTVRATVTVKEVNVEKNRVTLDTVCTVAGKTVIEGECVMMPPVRAKAVGGTA